MFASVLINNQLKIIIFGSIMATLVMTGAFAVVNSYEYHPSSYEEMSGGMAGLLILALIYSFGSLGMIA